MRAGWGQKYEAVQGGPAQPCVDYRGKRFPIEGMDTEKECDRCGEKGRGSGLRSFIHGCVSFLAARIPAATESRSHMYAPCSVFP
jgi:hypothetical protein